MSSLYTTENPLRVMLAMNPHSSKWVREQLFIAADLDIAEHTNSGEMVLRLLDSDEFDILLLGLQLSDMTGADLLEKLDRRLPTLLVVQEDIPSKLLREVYEKGVADVLITPSAEQLVDAIYQTVLRFQQGSNEEHKQDLEPDTVIGGVGPISSSSGRIICVYSPKGGVGNSYLTVGLARALQSDEPGMRMQVGILDLGMAYGVQASLLGLLEGELVNLGGLVVGSPPEELLLRHPLHGIYLVAGAVHPGEADMIQREDLERLLSYLCTRCDVVLVDAGPTLGYSVHAAMDHADHIVITMNPELTSVKHVLDFRSLAMGQLHYPPDKFLVALTKSDPEIERKLPMNKIENMLGCRINIRVPELPDHGEAMISGSLPHEVFDLAHLILNADQPTPSSSSV